MKKLLVLALLGLILGAGAWKFQNPEGTVSDARQQAADLGERLKSGLHAVSQPAQPQTVAQPDLSQQQALDERLSRLEESVVADNGADLPLSSSVDELAMVAQDAEAGNAANVVRLDAIDSRLALLVRRLDEQTVDKSLQSIQETVDTLGVEVSALRDSSGNSEAAVSNELASLNEKLTALDLRLDTLVSGQLDATSDASGDNSAGTASLAATLDQRLKSLESQLASVNSDSRRIATLSEQLEAAREEIRQLQQSANSNRRSVNRLNGSMSELRAAGESLSIDATQAEINDQLALIESQLESNGAAGNTAALQTLLTNTRNRLQGLDQRIRELPASAPEVSTVQETQSALESQLVAIDTQLQNTDAASPDLADTLSDVQQKVDQLASRDFVTREDLRAQTEPEAVQYKIYFDRNSVDITDDAAAVLDSFITQEKNRTTGVSIFGFTDTQGSATYNQQLALQRATNVRSYLIRNGFDYTKIMALNGLGEDAAAAILPDNADDAQQRVVMLYASQP